ncbi:CubicO group peptidase (beta-lactamase class C family) [Brevibacterium sanguinis]|uniref:CubicO group peptidase (Beta-lactamase class C family) n=2 Tax=Brevibacterium TaxID=1696 RepID=A0A366INC0_9MICO|nr:MULTISPECIES: serine hydrolase domain-containing protein [Brevibacterium]RBP67140.1 CubicO group peptidase (beta-lactamase class C family) [Brevibacterium sanguinis]RBP73665.1 CubicO group peptidase (beta-lactamase class C family) [Brevibacterium celere]
MSRRTTAAAVAAALVAALLLLITPFPRGFQGDPTGDARLRTEVTGVLGSGHWHHLAAARISGEEVRWAGVGADEHTVVEIGSISKTFTAALYADALERGEITASTRLGDVWPELDGDVAEVTLESIATHRSGLPRTEPAPSVVDGIAAIAAGYLHTNPYRASARELVDSLHDVEIGKRTPEYSNFGYSILGQALAEVTGRSYAALVRERITEPLGMEETSVPASGEGLSHGYTASGLPATPWALDGAAPAGGIRSTVHDLSIWLRATAAGTAPGARAAAPREDFDEDDEIGWAWFTRKAGTDAVTWHNGGTGGYRSVLGLDSDSGEGIIVLVDTATSVDAALTLLDEGAAPAGDPTSAGVAGRASARDEGASR